jgi:hypothetical protein
VKPVRPKAHSRGRQSAPSSAGQGNQRRLTSAATALHEEPFPYRAGDAAPIPPSEFRVSLTSSAALAGSGSRSSAPAASASFPPTGTSIPSRPTPRISAKPHTATSTPWPWPTSRSSTSSAPASPASPSASRASPRNSASAAITASTTRSRASDAPIPPKSFASTPSLAFDRNLHRRDTAALRKARTAPESFAGVGARMSRAQHHCAATEWTARRLT